MIDTLMISPRHLGGRIVDTVGAQELWASLRSDTPFDDWLAGTLVALGGREGVDWRHEEAGVRYSLLFALSVAENSRWESSETNRVQEGLRGCLAPRIEADLSQFDWRAAGSRLSRQDRSLCNTMSFDGREQDTQRKKSQAYWLIAHGHLKTD